MNKQRQAIWDKSGGKCWYCGCDLPQKGWHADHVEPIYRMLQYDSNRGLHTTSECHLPKRDNVDNKVPSCASCNINKHTMSVEEFRRQIQRYVDSLNARNTQYIVAKRYGLIAETNIPVVFWFEAQSGEFEEDDGQCK